MKNGTSIMMAVGIPLRSTRNYFTNRTLCVSFEVTHSCTANCQHCDKGGLKKEDNLLPVKGYSALVSALRPPIIQISGGEPLLREGVTDIVRAIKQRNGLPYIVFVTNGSLLNEKEYKALKGAGVDRFSVSLDFPDERHDSFRRYRGLYAHLEETIPRLAADFGYNDIVMNSAITQRNLPYLRELADRAEEWGVAISYSAYCILRTGSEDLFISSQEDLGMLRQSMLELIQIKREKRHVLNSPVTFLKTYKFFRDGSIPDCAAGQKFLVVRPDGTLNPCSMFPKNQYSTQAEMMEDFTRNNKCGKCYVAIRAYSEMSLVELAKEYASLVAQYMSKKGRIATEAQRKS